MQTPPRVYTCILAMQCTLVGICGELYPYLCVCFPPRITTALDRVVDSIPLPENNTNGTQTVTLAFRNFAIQVVQPPQDNTTSFSPDVTSLLATANNMSESRSRGTEFTASALTLPPGLGSSGGRLALAVFLTASLYPPSDQSVVGSIVMSVSFPNLVVENLENPVIFTFPKSEVSEI